MRKLMIIVAIAWWPTVAVAHDVVPGDDACDTFEHWEGGHDGGCVSDCAVSAPGRQAAPWGALAMLALAVVISRRVRTSSR